MEITYFRVHYLIAGDKRRRLARCIADWLGEDVTEKNGVYKADYFTIDKNGSLTFPDRADSEVVEDLLEHLYDLGFSGEPSELDALKNELVDICEKTNTRLSGMLYLVCYYTESLHFSEEEAYRQAVGLFHGGAIGQIKLFDKDGEEL